MPQPDSQLGYGPSLRMDRLNVSPIQLCRRVRLDVGACSGDSVRAIDSTCGAWRSNLCPFPPRGAFRSEQKPLSIFEYRLCRSHSCDFVCSLSSAHFYNAFHASSSIGTSAHDDPGSYRYVVSSGTPACRDAVSVPLLVKLCPEVWANRDVPASLHPFFRSRTKYPSRSIIHATCIVMHLLSSMVCFLRMCQVLCSRRCMCLRLYSSEYVSAFILESFSRRRSFIAPHFPLQDAEEPSVFFAEMFTCSRWPRGRCCSGYVILSKDLHFFFNRATVCLHFLLLVLSSVLCLRSPSIRIRLRVSASVSLASSRHVSLTVISSRMG